MEGHAFLSEQQPGAAEAHLPNVLGEYNHDQQAVHMSGSDQQQLQHNNVEQGLPVYQYQDVSGTGAPPFGASAQPFPAAIPGSSAVADLGAALRRGGTVGDVPRQLYQHEAMLENSKKCGTEGPKSYNDALAKKYGRKKGDMGSSSAGVKDRGIFPSVEYRNPDHPRDAVELRAKLGPLLVILASRSTTPESVMAELRRVRNGWIEADYRAWLKAFNPDKRPRLSHGYPQGADGNSSDDEYEDMNNAMANPLSNAIMGLHTAGQTGFPAGDSSIGTATPSGQQAAAHLEAALRKRGSPDGAGVAAAAPIAPPAPRPQTSQSTGPGDAAAGSEAGGEEHETPSTIDILRLFVDASYQKGIVTRSQVQEMMAFVEECYNVPNLPPPSSHLAWQHAA